MKAITLLKDLLPHGVVRFIVDRRAETRMVARQRLLFSNFIAPGSLVFDIGANVGNRITAALDCGARVIAVEPQPACTRLLRRKFLRRDVTVIEAGVGASLGKSELFASGTRDTLATFSESFMTYAKRSGRFGQTRWTEKFEVEMVTLDSLILAYGVPDFIKIDVEGFEEKVLLGLNQQVRALSFEWTLDFTSSALACVRRLRALGFDRFNFSFGESQTLVKRTPITAAEMLSVIDALDGERNLFGDIYAFAD